MSWELRDNSGTLFKNERRTQENHPHMRGTCMIDGKVYEVSAWTKEGAKGRFQSLAFKLKEDDDDGNTGNSNRGTGSNSGRGDRGSGSSNNTTGNRKNHHQDFTEDDDIPF